MDLSNQQEQAIKEVDEWFTNRSTEQQVFRLMGYAGTGKTTLAKYFAQNVKGVVSFAAYTGKASYVLRQKGCPATTIHQQIYRPRDKSRAHLLELQTKLAEMVEEQEKSPSDQLAHQIRELQKHVTDESGKLHQPAFELWTESPIKHSSLIVIDECSMVDEKMGLDLLSFKVPVLVLGDPAQLPPVIGSGYFTNSEPDFMLTDIHRQAKDNPIIQLATRVREQRGLQIGTFGESRVIQRKDLPVEAWMNADQILVGKNLTRTASNARMRELLGFQNIAGPDPRLPKLHDRLVCLRNNHELGLLNGSLWYVSNVEQDCLIESDPPKMLLNIKSDEIGDAGELNELMIHTFPFHSVDKKKIAPWHIKEAEEFDYGYALTCHKAQGSQWEHVVVYDESAVFKHNRHRWLYTAITRASLKVDIVKP